MQQAKSGNLVKIHYTGRLDDGTVFATSAMSEPLEFTLGNAEVLPVIEDAVEGLQVGETKTIFIPMEEAYGPRLEELIQKVPWENLPDGIELEAGQMLWIDQPGDEPVMVQVVEICDDGVIMDSNHPLAGENLTFDLQLVSID